MLKENAFAKLNLGLNITGINAQGYHTLEMIEVPISLSDEISLFKSQDYCLISNIDLPENNTIYQAIETARKHFHFKDNFTVVLEKDIPSQAGMGGGSSDAATVLRLLRKHFAWNITDADLAKIGIEIGADVPFCIFNKPAVVKGIGEKLEFFDIHENYIFLIIKPKDGVSTKLAYHEYNEQTADHPNVKLLKKALIVGNDKTITKHMGNSLEKAAFSLNPQIAPLIKELKSMGCSKALMTGSGSAVFAMSRDLNKILDIQKHFVSRFSYVKIANVQKNVY